MTAAGGEVRVRWLDGLGSCPGAVDLTLIGPAGPIERAVPLPEAMTVGLLIDLVFPASNWCDTISQLVPSTARSRWAPDETPRHDAPGTRCRVQH
jgi:hypothetical protein